MKVAEIKKRLKEIEKEKDALRQEEHVIRQELRLRCKHKSYQYTRPHTLYTSYNDDPYCGGLDYIDGKCVCSECGRVWIGKWKNHPARIVWDRGAPIKKDELNGNYGLGLNPTIKGEVER
jgi:hypothetical protein